ncbi:addiction module antitoxin [Sphingobium sp. IP1]|uniref:type II toxin-antitoxin system ParD family antitoxin n=1 Tax=Sphingobium sp. IP1 TaxID=2021637 RepID=UPI000C08CEA3|nr:type II toxin-antitoxin system ParD family antitoxin [Sphingobium sp. IP1]PHP20462.1 addiction module antitoxin [Sphingobium sp. IP1]
MPSSFTLGSHFEGFIKRQVGSGRYASASEVVRDSLRLLEEREEERAPQMEALRAEIDKGTSSGPGIPANQVFDKLRARIGQTGNKHAG